MFTQKWNISNNSYCDRSPCFTPDGAKIVFVSDRDADWEIYSMNLDGSEQRRLTDSPGIDRSPAVSPDGRLIAFVSDREGDLDPYLMNLDGSERRVLFPRSGNEDDPIWAPDGKTVACTLSARQERRILELRFGLGGARPMTLEKVGKRMKVSRERIRQLQVRAIRKLQRPGLIEKLEGFVPDPA